MKMIVACAQNRTIARQGRLPWHLPDDLAYFRRCVAGAYLVMGRRTYESMPRMPDHTYPLVISSTLAALPIPGEILRDPKEVFAYTDHDRPLWIIGGESVYAYFLPYTHQLYMTEVHAVVAGDRVFPAWRREDFRDCSRLSCHDASAHLDFDLVVYEQCAPRIYCPED